MRTTRRFLAGIAMLCAGRPATAQDSSAAGSSCPAGRWEGTAQVPGSPPIRLTISLDSAEGGWRGTLVASAMNGQVVPFASVACTRDSVVLRLPASAQGAVLRGRPSPDGRFVRGAVETSGGRGAFTIARAGTAEAAALVAEASRVETSRQAAAKLAGAPAASPLADPDSAKLVTSDIQLFWRVVDRAPPESLGAFLHRDYLEGGTVGVRDFIPGRILSGEDLATYYRVNRARYDSVRAANLDVARAEPAIRRAFRQLKAIYQAAVFPDVYFVIGRFNSGGTASNHGLLIGAEMYRDPAALPGIVSHELIHFQQHYQSPTLLEQSFKEGSADFIGELISGGQINNAAHVYGRANERLLWQEFTPHFDDRTFFPWMYATPPNGRPNDLGYFIGYRIAQAYYNRMPDKRQAIRDIITGGGSVKELLARSGYNP